MSKCKTGKKLLHDWAASVQKASGREWQMVMFGKREFDKHKRKCKKCKGAIK